MAAGGTALAQVSSAKAVCARCPVQLNCLSYALETMPVGIWGGTTAEERLAARRAVRGQASAQSHGGLSAAVTGEPAARTGHAAGQRATSGRTA